MKIINYFQTLSHFFCDLAVVATLAFTTTLVSLAQASEAPKPLMVGLSADMSSLTAEAGIGIQRGAELAIEEINATGGVLGRPLKLVIKDHRGNPARGADDMQAFAAMEDVLAVIGGKQTQVALRQLAIAQDAELPFLLPWANATKLIDNGFDPNYAFRISARDDDVGTFLVEQAIKAGFSKPVLLLINNAWGQSNEKALNGALAKKGRNLAPVVWVLKGTDDFAGLINKHKAHKGDVFIMAMSTREAIGIVKAMADLKAADRLPILSHWSVSAGRFFEGTKDHLEKVDLKFLQTASFIEPDNSQRVLRLIARYHQRYGTPGGVKRVTAPAGVAHTYDLVQLLNWAARQAGSSEGPKIRKSLLAIQRYPGVVRDYEPPFQAGRQDALDSGDFHLGYFDSGGAILRAVTP